MNTVAAEGMVVTYHPEKFEPENIALASSVLLKRLMDLCISAAAIILFSPLLLLIATAIRLDSRGPVFYKQQRIGKNNSIINVYKFRSMHCTPETYFQQATVNDPRVTRVGRLLRRTSLDELPQLFNVMAGAMSLVGPRPHPIALDEHFSIKIPSYHTRYFVKPGITGMAQINGYRGETRQLSDMIGRINYDRLYIANWSVFLDIKILLITAFKGWIDKNAY